MVDEIDNNENINIIKDTDQVKDGQVKCPKCGSTDISTNTKTGKLRCNFCRHEFDPELAAEDADISSLQGNYLRTGAADIDSSADDMITLKCESCGAEVSLVQKYPFNKL